MTDQHQAAGKARSGIRGPQDFAAGLFLAAIALFAIWQASDLPLGTLRSMGPGMLPRAVAVMVGLGGVLLMVFSFFEEGPSLERVHWRGPLFILGGILLFGLTIRSAGLVVAGPLSMFVGALASDEFRWKEAAIFAIGLTAVCIVLFKFALGLPIPLLTLF